MQQTRHSKNLWPLIPILGILLFVVLYIIATLLYPGGSQADKNAVGFSWVNNYWCNLLYDNAINGQPNPAKHIAIMAMLILCATLAFFWCLFPKYIHVGKQLKVTMQVAGVCSMAIAFCLFTNFNHDFIINLASLFGLVATFGVFVGLYKTKWFGLFAFGVVNIVLVGLNNYFYHKQGLIVYLPVVQKISFASFLLWFCCISIQLYRTKLRHIR